MTKENEPDEKELWQRISQTEGAERAETLVELGHIANSKGDHKECLALIDTAREIYETLGAETSNTTLADVYTGISWTLKFLDRPAEAAAAAERASLLYREIGSVEVIGALRDEAAFWFEAKEYEKALEYYRKALAEPNPDEVQFHAGVDYYNIGKSLLELGKFDEALGNYITARQFFKKEKEPREVAVCDEEIAHCYNKLDNPSEAEHHARKALDFAKTAQNEGREFWACWELGLSFLKQGRLDEALEKLRRSLRIELNGEESDWNHVVDIEESIAEVFKARGEMAKADEILRRIATLKEILEEKEPEIDNENLNSR